MGRESVELKAASYRCPGSARSVAGAPVTLVASTPAATAAEVTARAAGKDLPRAPPRGGFLNGSLTSAATDWPEFKLMMGVAASTSLPEPRSSTT